MNRALKVIVTNILLAVILIWSLARLEPLVHQVFFPHLSEAENQTYMLGLAVFFFFQFMLYQIVKAGTTNDSVRSKRRQFMVLVIIAGTTLLVSLVAESQILHSAGVQETLKLIEIYYADKLSERHFLVGGLVALGIVFGLIAKVKWSKISKIFWHTLAIIIILWLSLGLGNINLYDYANYAGPINDLLLGKPLLTYRTSYGFLPVLLLSFVFHILPLTSRYLHIEIVVLGAMGFLLYYSLAYSVFHDQRWALITTLSSITVGHLVTHGATYQIPQQTFIRMGFWIPVALALSHQQWVRQRSTILSQYLPLALVSLSFFWSADFGLYTILAYCLYLFIMKLKTNIVQFLKTYTLQLTRLSVVLISVFAIINLIYFISYSRLPMWMTHYFSIYGYQRTGAMVPVPKIPALWVFVLIPVASLSLLLFQKKIQRRLEPDQQAVLFASCVGLATFNYFLGRSYLNSLNALSLSVMLCLFYLCKTFIDNLKRTSAKAAIAGALSLGALLYVPATLFTYQASQTLSFANPITTIRILRYEMPEVTDENYWVGPTARALETKYGNEVKSGRLTMLSTWDTWFLVIYHTTNRAGINCLICYYFPAEDLSFIVDNIKKSPSPYLFVDNNRTLEGKRVEYLLAGLKDQYDYVEKIGFLDVYKRK